MCFLSFLADVFIPIPLVFKMLRAYGQVDIWIYKPVCVFVHLLVSSLYLILTAIMGAWENVLFPDGSVLSPGVITLPYLFRRWLEGIRPAQESRSEIFQACHQSASFWSTIWRMSPFWKGNPASAQGMVGSSWGQYSVMARTYIWQEVHNGTVRRTLAHGPLSLKTISPLLPLLCLSVLFILTIKKNLALELSLRVAKK